METTLSTIALSVLVGASVFTSMLFSVRVLRGRRDAFSWSVLGLLSSLALSNLPLLLRFTIWPDTPLWVGQILRTTSAVFVMWATWPLICDSWREFRAWVCVWCHRCTAAINKKR